MKPNFPTRFRGTHIARIVLLPSSLVAVLIAATILFAPEVFYAGYGIEVGGNATLANELKAPAGALLVAGMLMFAGVFRADFAVTSLTTATLVYLSYGAARLMSMAADGIPHGGMVGAALIEIVIGSVCLLTLLYVRRSKAAQAPGQSHSVVLLPDGPDHVVIRPQGHPPGRGQPGQA